MRICSSSSDMSDRYNNLKSAWDSLMEAAEPTSPQGFRVAVTGHGGLGVAEEGRAQEEKR
jgi:hypothetical protein